MSFKLLLVFQAQPFGGSAASDNNASRFDPFSIDLHSMILFAGFKFFKFGVAEPGAEFFRLFMHVHDQLRSVDTVRESGEILDERGRGQLTTRFSSLEDEGKCKQRRVRTGLALPVLLS